LKAVAAYAGKRVLITGHTGFKGSWLTTWLLKADAHVIGLSNGVPTEPAMFDVLALGERVTHNAADIRDLQSVKAIVKRERPDFFIHLAAQAIVSRSYNDPIETITSNTVGTMNVLEALRDIDWPCVAVLITSDKCYDNVEWEWGYRETDRLGGKDVYSGSKAAAELIIRSYLASFFAGVDGPVKIGIARAGNVIGGGDWAKDRIVADCLRAWSKNRPVEVRHPEAIRPWQHALEPLSGYLVLGAALAQSNRLHGEAFNFGPRSEESYSVLRMITDMAEGWSDEGAGSMIRVAEHASFHEARLLKLNCDKSLFHLKWEPTLSYPETIQFTREWYRGFYRRHADMYRLTLDQISEYERLACERERNWAA
jgi:CDP-glucose 4,6-dehydratase